MNVALKIIALGGATGLLAAMLAAEDRRPLRALRSDRPKRQFTNIVLGSGSLLAAALVQRGVLAPLLAADAGRYGLTRFLPRSLHVPAAFLMMDWAMYWWHRLTHVVPFLWRLHRVHHVDLGLDMSTALRFHAVDQLVSTPWRVAMIVGIGPRHSSHELWNRFFFASVLFHHANIALPAAFERRLALALTTPRMHGIHHMARRAATDSNWSSGISLWDRLHGTLCTNFGDEAIRIGVAGYPHPIGIFRSLDLPLRTTVNDWNNAGPSSQHDELQAQT